MLPCPECGAEAVRGEGTTVEVERDFEFGGETATRELPGKICPECGHEKEIDAIYDGEMFRSTTCPGCGEWFTVYDER